MGLSHGVLFRSCLLQGGGSHAYWQIARHVLWRFSLLPRTKLSPNPLHLSQEGSVLYPRSFPLIHLLSSLSSKPPPPPLAWASRQCPSPSTLLAGSSPPTHRPSSPSHLALLELICLKSLSFRGCGGSRGFEMEESRRTRPGPGPAG